MARLPSISPAYFAAQPAESESVLYASFVAPFVLSESGLNELMSAVAIAGRPMRSICAPSVGAAGGRSPLVPLSPLLLAPLSTPLDPLLLLLLEAPLSLLLQAKT